MSCGLSARAFIGERHYTQAHFWVKDSAIQSFAAANEAYKAMPLDGRNRMQMALAVANLVSAHDKTQVTPDAADRIHAIASSASPNHALTRIARATYLMRSGRWRDSDELHRIIASLQVNARSYPQTWIVVAYHASLTGHPEKAGEALIAALNVGGSLVEMQKVASDLNLEIIEQ